MIDIFIVLLGLVFIGALPFAAVRILLQMRSNSSPVSESRRSLGLACFMGGMLPILTLIHVFKAQRLYEAVARIQIGREEEFVMVPAPPPSRDQEDSVYLQTQQKNLLSRTLLESVYRDRELRLADDPRFANKPDVVRALADDITIVPILSTRVVDIKVQNPDPRKAAAIANTLVRAFIDRHLDRQTEAFSRRVSQLETEADTLRRRVLESEGALERYRSETHFTPSIEGRNLVAEALVKAQTAHADAQSRSERATRAVAALDQHVAEGKALAASH
jgi:uncharacterized protein involved in exopolysaccharide biosynthesis